MIQLPGYKIVEALYSGEKSSVFRGFKDTSSVIIKTSKNEFPSLQDLNRLKYEYEILTHLKSTSIIQVLRLEKHKNGLAIILEDIGGKSLSELYNKSDMDLSIVLEIAEKITKSLGEIHSCHVIHRDIKPQNIIFNTSNLELRLIDFGMASLLTKQDISLPVGSSLEGTIAYISPEQSGRMNRSVDYRTDFYSLGVTLYQLLTKELPFWSNDPMELIHAHIAKIPISPFDKNSTPKVLSDIVMKLLEKNPENRYQSAFSLLQDILWCKEVLHGEGAEKLHTFTYQIAKNDRYPYFQIPGKLYGREQDIQVLFSNFQKVQFSGQPQFTLIGGYSGIGKSSLIQEIYKPITESKGYFVSGKFDQYNKNTPFSAIIQIFSKIVKQLLGENSERISSWKQKILSALGNNGSIITEVIPELELIIGKQIQATELSPQENANRFYLAFQNFIKVFTIKEHPLTIFLDDMQWADNASLDLLYNLAHDSSANYLFIMMSYRTNEVDEHHPFFQMISKLKEVGQDVSTIQLEPLNLKNIQEILADTLLQNLDIVKPFANILLQKTGGNPFFINEILKELYKEDIIRYNNESGTWTWDIEKIQNIHITNNVVELMVTKIKRLSPKTSELLRNASCIGIEFDLFTLYSILNYQIQDIINSLKEAIKTELIQPIDDNYQLIMIIGDQSDIDLQKFLSESKIIFRFLHDKIQEACYESWDQTKKSETHLKIGRLLLKSSEAIIEENIFNLLGHWNAGISLITDDSEKIKLMEFNYSAARKAKSSTAYNFAMKYLKMAQSLLPSHYWQTNYEFTFSLIKEIIEVSYLNGDTQNAIQLVEINIANCKNEIDKGVLLNYLITIYSMQGKFDKSYEIIKKILSLFQIEIEGKDPNQLFMQEVELINQRKGDRSFDDLIHLPLINNPAQELLAKTLTNSTATAYQYATQLFPWITAKLVNIFLEYGNSNDSYGYALYGIVLNGTFRNYKESYDSMLLAYNIGLKYKNDSAQTKALNLLANYGIPFRKHYKESIELNSKCFSIYMECGELEHGGYSIGHHCASLLFTGDDLIRSLKLIESRKSIVKKNRHLIALDNTTGAHLAIRSLVYAKSISFEAEELEFLNSFHENKGKFPLAMYLVQREYAQFILGNYDVCIKYSEQAESLLPYISGLSYLVEHNFINSLVYSYKHRIAKRNEKKKILDKMNTNQSQLKIWAENNPENYLCKYYLVEGEKYRIKKKYWDAIKNYDEAIAEARRNEFIQIEGLANELTAYFWLEQGKENIAKPYLQEAIRCYEIWGAARKCEILREKFPQYFKVQKFITTTHSATSSSTEKNIPNEKLAEMYFDLFSILKSATAISRELKLDELISKIMKIVIENAGAERGLLLLQFDDKLYVKYEISTQSARSVNNILNIPFEEYSNIASSIIHYISRTKENILIGNCLEEHQFSQDPYFSQKEVKSLLGSPIMNQGKLRGILYLENNLLTDVFTDQRIQLVNVISSQAAISIDNALVYENLEAKVEERTLDLKEALGKVRALKEQQDGDYYLNSILIEPLGTNLSKNPYFQLDTYLKQKKTFTFRGKEYELGGDINISDIIYLQGKSYIVFLNGDAMGKSIQGAGGVLVLGTVFKSILQRSALTENKENLTPEIWLQTALNEIHKVFESFDGRMLMSAILGLIDEKDGILYFLNADHPDLILYRDKKATFISKPRKLWKLGSYYQLENAEVMKLQLNMGDCIICGSDGKDDIITGRDGETGLLNVNSDFSLILKFVEEADADLSKIYSLVSNYGEIMDDFSLLKIEFLDTHSQ